MSGLVNYRLVSPKIKTLDGTVSSWIPKLIRPFPVLDELTSHIENVDEKMKFP